MKWRLQPSHTPRDEALNCFEASDHIRDITVLSAGDSPSMSSEGHAVVVVQEFC